MTHRLICCVILTLTFTLSASAQGKKPAGGASAPTITRPPNNGQPSLNSPDLGSGGQRAFVFGKVVLDDGSQLTESASIQTVCQGRRQTVTHTDSKGGFSFEMGDSISAAAAGVSSADSDIGAGSRLGGGGTSRRNWRNCEILAALPGFTSQSVDLTSRISNFESTDIGRLVLHRMGQVEGYTISATSAAAPKDAQKAYEKSRDKARKEKWDEAQALLTKAVEIYPKYAVAWFDLGRLQLRNNDIDKARNSFEQSIAADAKFTYPYRGLAEIENRQKQWPALVNISDRLVALDPVSFPDAWFLNSLGNYYLSNFAAAEKSARHGLKVDDQHQFPKLEQLLGMILAQERNYPEATLHIQNYLKFATQPGEIENAQKQLAEINRVSALASPPAAEEKK
jgi:Tetratricopeptide repeat